MKPTYAFVVYILKCDSKIIYGWICNLDSWFDINY